MSEIITDSHTLSAPFPALNPGLIRLLSWNIQKQRAPKVHGELKAFSRQIDLALLQEVWLEDCISQSFGPPWMPTFSHGYTTARRTTGVMTLSPTEVSKVLHHQALEPLLRTAKATGITHFPLVGREHDLLVVNIHAINFTFGTRGYKAQLDTVLPEIEDHRGPVIFGGDLNTWSPQRIAVLESFTEYLGLEEVYYDVDHRKRILTRPLDYVFVRDMEIHDAMTASSRFSDHNPMLVSLSCK